MKTPIIKISEDQNEITHESGLITVFEIPKGKAVCRNCAYVDMNNNCNVIPCTSDIRNDNRNGIFKIKQHETNKK